jgi:autophagy-related protein 27
MKPTTLPLLTASLLLSSLSFALTFDCSHIRAHGKKFNFEKIGGPHSVSVIENFPPSVHNTTWTVDLCGPLKKVPGVKPDDQCTTGTYGRIIIFI